jgi:hypothetical protein
MSEEEIIPRNENNNGTPRRAPSPNMQKLIEQESTKKKKRHSKKHKDIASHAKESPTITNSVTNSLQNAQLNEISKSFINIQRNTLNLKNFP